MILRNQLLVAARCMEHDWVMAGPRDTGKTFMTCYKAHQFCLNVPKCRGALVRKVQAHMAASVLATFRRVLAAEGGGARELGGTKPTMYEYPNGATIRVLGMDKGGSALSSEYDFVCVNQTEELEESDWELLSGSCSGRGAVVAHPQCFGDANPAGSMHWILRRQKDGKLRLFEAFHKDNPDLYDAEGNEMPGAAARLQVLRDYTGVRRERLFLGKWVTAEGAVYENFDKRVHVLERDPREMVRWFECLDHGFTNPAVILLVGQDADGRRHVFREWYKTGVLQGPQVAQALAWFRRPAVSAGLVPEPEPTPEQLAAGARRQFLPTCDVAVVDEAVPQLIAELNDNGVRAVGAKGKIEDGCNALRDRLGVAGDGRPRLTVDPSCENTINEFESYVFKKGTDQPEDANNHSMDALRYLGTHLGEKSGAFDAKSIKGVTVGQNQNNQRSGAQQQGPRRWTNVRQWSGR